MLYYFEINCLSFLNTKNLCWGPAQAQAKGNMVIAYSHIAWWFLHDVDIITKNMINSKPLVVLLHITYVQ